ncbi:MAG: hypothetical protein VKK32_03375 [Candidatus Melainabacteria bacterium]|nr:hypothetical protein [Candidatus Melainabacteria bacterium]
MDKPKEDSINSEKPEEDEYPDFEKLAQDLEKDLEDFFSMRAMERSTRPDSDGACRSGKLEDAMSGCCMTGCPGCPWGYELPSFK